MEFHVRTDIESARLLYTLNYMFEGADHPEMVINPTHDTNSNKCLIQYGRATSPLADIYIPSGPFLKEGFSERDLNFEEWTSTKAVFEIEGQRAKARFDILGAVFYFLSRMEEYHTESKDSLGRFSGCDSCLFKNGLQFNALVDRWRQEFRDVMESIAGMNLFPKFTPAIKASCDVDSAYAFQGSGSGRLLMGGLHQLLKGNFSDFLVRSKWFFGEDKDPYDTIDYLIDSAMKGKSDLRCFVLLPCEIRDKRDKTSNQKVDILGKLNDRFKKNIKWGLHPSISAGNNGDKVRMEKEKLEGVFNQPIAHSRQHYLRLDFPDTNRALIDAGITDDHSMGFFDSPGFRAATSRPFKWYDLEEEREMPLVIHPLLIMDASLKVHLKYSPEQAKKLIDSILNEINYTNGFFSYLWHNSSLSDLDGWGDWVEVFEYMVEKCHLWLSENAHKE